MYLQTAAFNTTGTMFLLLDKHQTKYECLIILKTLSINS